MSCSCLMEFSFSSLSGCEKEGRCVWKTRRQRERKSDGLCVFLCMCMLYDYMSSVDHINQSCKQDHSKMRNAFSALAGKRKWHWTFIYKLKTSCSADMHLMGGKKSSFHHIHVSAHSSKPTPESRTHPSPTLRPRCHDCVWTRSNGRMGADKWESINQYHERRRNNICWNRGWAIGEISACSQCEHREL